MRRLAPGMPRQRVADSRDRQGRSIKQKNIEHPTSNNQHPRNSIESRPRTNRLRIPDTVEKPWSELGPSRCTQHPMGDRTAPSSINRRLLIARFAAAGKSSCEHLHNSELDIEAT